MQQEINTKDTDCRCRYDSKIDRHGTGCLKYDALPEYFGRDNLLPLWIADMDFTVNPAITDALVRRLSHPVLGYSTVPESYWRSIISWLSRRHGWDVRREELTHVGGIVRGIGLVINYFTRPGDRILIQPPVYHPFKRLVDENDRVCIENPLVEADGTYVMDFADLEEKMRVHSPALMILCNPHNPAGIQWSGEQLAEVARLADKYGVKVVSDEIHGDLMLGGRRHIPYLTVSPEARRTGIALGAPSKTFNIPGLASSWIVISDPKLRGGFYKWMETNELSAPSLPVTVATEAAYNNGDQWLDDTLEYISDNIDYVESWLGDNIPQLRIIRPQASFLVWVDCRGLGLSHERLLDLFVCRAGLALNDGEMFGTGGTGFMRLNVGTCRDCLTEALCRLKEAVDTL